VESDKPQTLSQEQHLQLVKNEDFAKSVRSMLVQAFLTQTQYRLQGVQSEVSTLKQMALPYTINPRGSSLAGGGHPGALKWKR